MSEDQDRDDRAILISNERVKLRATFLNGPGVAIFAVAALAPVVSALSSTTPPSP